MAIDDKNRVVVKRKAFEESSYSAAEFNEFMNDPYIRNNIIDVPSNLNTFIADNKEGYNAFYMVCTLAKDLINANQKTDLDKNIAKIVNVSDTTALYNIISDNKLMTVQDTTAFYHVKPNDRPDDSKYEEEYTRYITDNINGFKDMRDNKSKMEEVLQDSTIIKDYEAKTGKKAEKTQKITYTSDYKKWIAVTFPKAKDPTELYPIAKYQSKYTEKTGKKPTE